MADKEGFSNWSQLFCLWPSLLLPNSTNYSQTGPKHAFTQATPFSDSWFRNPDSFFVTQFTYHFFYESFFACPDSPHHGITGLGIARFSAKALITWHHRSLKYLFVSHVLPYFAVYNEHPHFWPKLSGEKIFPFNFLIQLFVYLNLETKPIKYSRVLFCIRIPFLLSRITLLAHKHSINKRI